jgi:hypothetical protein
MTRLQDRKACRAPSPFWDNDDQHWLCDLLEEHGGPHSVELPDRSRTWWFPFDNTTMVATR